VKAGEGKPVTAKAPAAPEAPVPPTGGILIPVAPPVEDVVDGDAAEVQPEEELFEEKQLGVQVVFVRVDGYWVPEALAEAWGPKLEKFSEDLDGSLSEYSAQRDEWLAISRKAVDAAARFVETGDFMVLLGVLPR
jgi:hypothetical protein